MQREGQIKEKHCTDIIVKLHDNVMQEVEDETVEQRTMSKGNKYFSRDRLRFDVTDVSTERALGNKDVECFIWRTRVDFESFSGVAADMKPQLEQMILDCDDDSMMNSITSVSAEKDKRPLVNTHKYETRYRGSIWVPAIAILICLVLLSLPHENSENSSSSWLTSTENQRLIASYILGILTMIIVQYQQ